MIRKQIVKPGRNREDPTRRIVQCLPERRGAQRLTAELQTTASRN